MTKNTKFLTIGIFIAVLAVFFGVAKNIAVSPTVPEQVEPQVEKSEDKKALHPMAIEALRGREYPGSNIVIEQELDKTNAYRQYIASYSSDGLKIYGLLTVPTSAKPDKGFPAIIFLHGYIPPKEYNTTKNYAGYQPMLARNGFVTFKPDLRGHGRSEGDPVTAHFSEGYVVDTLNLVSSLQKYAEVDGDRIGVWGHSNGGETGLRAMVSSSNIKAGVFWAGVVGSFPDMLDVYTTRIPFLRDFREQPLIKEYGTPLENPDFWNQLDPYTYLKDISGPIQLHHGTRDTSVPHELSIRLKDELEKVNKPVEYYEYRGDSHNLTRSLNPAWQRTIEFFKKNL